MIAISNIILLMLITATCIDASQKKKKDVRDFTDADMDRLFDEWEENDEDELPEDEKPDYEKPRPDINLEELKEKANSPDDLMKLSKKGQSVMMFVSVTDGKSDKPSRSFTEKLSDLWQSNLYNNHIDLQSFVIDDDRILFMFKDGSRAWEGRDFLLKQEYCKDVTLEGNTMPGAGVTKKTEL